MKNAITKSIYHIKKFLTKIYFRIILNQNGGSLIESGLLIGFAVLLFILIISIATDMYAWVDDFVNTNIKEKPLLP
jgi:hypothetical protein